MKISKRLLIQGKIEEAFIEIELVIELDSKNVWAHYYKGLWLFRIKIGIMLLKLGKFIEALIVIDKAIGLNPKVVELHCIKGESLFKITISKRLLFELQRYDESFKELNTAIELNPQISDPYFYQCLQIILSKLGWILFRIILSKRLLEEGKFEEALIALDKVIELNSQKILMVHYFKGLKILLLIKLFKKYEESMKVFDKAIELDPQIPYGYYYKGLKILLSKLGLALFTIILNKRLLFELQKYEESVIVFNKGIELDPQMPQLHYYKGLALFTIILNKRLLLRLKKYEESLKEINTAIELNLQIPHLHYFQGVALFRSIISKRLFRLKKNQLAIIAFDKAIKLDPQNVDYHFYKAVALFTIIINNKLFNLRYFIQSVIEIYKGIKLWLKNNAIFIEQIFRLCILIWITFIFVAIFLLMLIWLIRCFIVKCSMSVFLNPFELVLKKLSKLLVQELEV